MISEGGRQFPFLFSVYLSFVFPIVPSHDSFSFEAKKKNGRACFFPICSVCFLFHPPVLSELHAALTRKAVAALLSVIAILCIVRMSSGMHGVP